MRWVFMQGFLVLAMEKGVMPTSVNPPLWERARDRQTAKQPWPQQEVANQALSMDNPQQLTEGVRVMAVVREADTVVEMAEVMAVATEVGTVVAMVVATEPPSNRR